MPNIKKEDKNDIKNKQKFNINTITEILFIKINIPIDTSARE